ncbi:MAG: hypothetical protein AB7G47_17030 [Mycolicibacterium sp.]
MNAAIAALPTAAPRSRVVDAGADSGEISRQASGCGRFARIFRGMSI